MINCIIVDDEQNAVDLLKRYVEASGLLHLAHATTSPFEALKVMNGQHIDIAFLDIDMPGMTGLELAKTMRGKCKVIFTTAYSEFVSDALDLGVPVVDYLLKPIPMSRFIRAAQRGIDSITGASTPSPAQRPLLNDGIDDNSLEHDYIFIRGEQKNKVIKIDLADVDYIEAMRNYMAIHHMGQKTMALLTMKDLEAELPRQHFIRVHKSFIVALRKIAFVTGNKVALQDSDVIITVSETYKPQLMEAMQYRLKE